MRKRSSIDLLSIGVKNKEIILISQSDNPNDVEIGFISCNHTYTFNLYALKDNFHKCLLCKKDKLTKDFENLGLEYLGDSNLKRKDGSVYKRLRIKSCGHIVLKTNSILKNNFKIKCEQCFIDEISSLSDRNNFKYLSRVDKNNCLLECNFCLNTKIAQYSNIRRSVLSCEYCNNSSKLRKSFFYIFHIQTKNLSWIKVGYSSNPYLRHINYNIKIDYYCSNIFDFEFETGKNAHEFEKKIHDKLNVFQINPNIMKNYMENGFSECYDEDYYWIILDFVFKELKIQ